MNGQHNHGFSSSERVLEQRAAMIARRLDTKYHEDAEKPVPARVLARVCGVAGSAETQRRHVREVVRFARDHAGLRICANLGGYWFARNAVEWATYLEARKTNARFVFVSVKRMKDASADRMARQGTLFPCGRSAAAVGF